MQAFAITVVINGNAYKLRPGDAGAAGAIPASERQQLIALLGTLKDAAGESPVIGQDSGPVSAALTPQSVGQIKPERLGAGDADALMARLVMEENRNKKSVPTRQSLYKWLAIGAVVLIVLVAVL